MLTKLEIQNYKSICNATIELSPFTLLIGANGTGKSNFLSLLRYISSPADVITIDSYGEKGLERVIDDEDYEYIENNEEFESFHREYARTFPKHRSHSESQQILKVFNTSKSFLEIVDNKIEDIRAFEKVPELKGVQIFKVEPDNAGKEEEIVSNPIVKADGRGVVQVLDSLKSGDRDDLFDRVERELKRYVPEIEKLSFVPGKSSKRIQVREKFIVEPTPLSELSEGTKLAIIILTILYQEDPPKLIGIEDIDRGIHPRLFQQIVELCHDLSKERGIQIIATTHNPYILDEFVGKESAVVIVEKKKGCTTFTTLAERLEQLEANGSDDEMPLGSLWYSGLVGGVPKR
jgi:predicted ATPase